MVKSAKSNTKVIKIAPEVDVQASNKTKQDIKKLRQDLESQFKNIGKAISGNEKGGLNKSLNDSFKEIIKTFKQSHPNLKKSINSNYSEIAKQLNSIQKEFIKNTTGLEKEFVKNLKSMLKETKATVNELYKETSNIGKGKQGTFVNKLGKNTSNPYTNEYIKSIEPIEKVMRDISRRVQIYFTYKTIDFFSQSIGSAVDSLIRLQSAFANIQAITASTTGQMEKIRKAVFDVGVNTRFATEEVADAAVVLGQAGLSTQEIASVLEHTATLASATGEDLKETASLMTSVLSVWNLNAEQSSHVADVFVTSANETKATLDSLSYGIQYAGTSLSQLGVSFEETSAVMAASTNAGLKSSSMLGTGMRALATELTNQSKRMQDTLASLGLTFDDVDIQSLGLIKVLKNLKEAGFGATEAFAAFDRRAATYALAALSELDTAERLTEEFNRSGAAAKANATQMATLESQLVSLSDNIAKSMSTSFRPLTDSLTLLLSGINNILKVGDSFVGKIIASATAAAVASKSFKLLYVNIRETIRMFNVRVGLNVWKEMSKNAEGFTTEMFRANVAAKSFFRTLTIGLAKWSAVGVLIYGFSEAIEHLFYGSKKLEDQIAELNESMETHRSTINSVTSDLDELANKESLYSDDIDTLNKRIAELNKKYSDNGFVVEYANANEDLSEKLKLVREELEAIDRIENKRRATAGYDVAKKKLQLSEDAIRKGSDISWWDQIGKADFTTVFSSTRREVRENIEKAGWSINDSKNYVLKQSENLENWAKNEGFSDEIISKYKSKFIDSLNEWIVAHFRLVEAEIDKKSAEFNDSAEGQEIENALDSLGQTEAGFVSYQLNDILSAVNEGKFESVNSADIVAAMKTISTEINNSFLEQLKLLESQIPEEFRSKTKSGSEITSMIGKIEKGTYTSKGVSDLLKILDSWRNESDFGKETASKADNLYNALNNYILSQIKTSGTLSDKEILRRAQDAARAANKSDKLNQPGREPRTNPFLERMRSEFSNISEMTKSAKKSRDLTLRGYQYKGSMTSTQSGLYKAYADELNLLETARNTERYSKILEELRDKYGYVLNKKEELTRVETTALDLMKDTENKLNESKDAYEVITGKTYEYGASLTDLNQKISELQTKLDETTENNLNPFQQVLQGITNKYQELMNKQKEEGSVFTQIGETIYNSGLTNMENALISICDRTKSVSDAFRQMLADILKEIRNFLIKQAVIQFFKMLGSYMIGSNADVSDVKITGGDYTGTASSGGNVTFTNASYPHAAGGMVTGGIKGRDSVHAKLMPGEYVIKKSAVDVLGSKFFNSLNTNAAQTMNTVGAMMGGTSIEGQSEPAVVNVWVVSEKDEAQMGPNDVIATISKDLQQGGTTKKLIQTIVAGRKA